MVIQLFIWKFFVRTVGYEVLRVFEIELQLGACIASVDIVIEERADIRGKCSQRTVDEIYKRSVSKFLFASGLSFNYFKTYSRAENLNKNSFQISQYHSH